RRSGSLRSAADTDAKTHALAEILCRDDGNDPSWYRYATLVMLAHAILAVIATRERASSPVDPDLIPLTANEIRRLFAKLVATTVHTITHWLAGSTWRRLHQARARASHYRRRGATA